MWLTTTRPTGGRSSNRTPGRHTRRGPAQLTGLARFERQTRKSRVLRDGKPEEYVDSYYARELSFLGSRPGVTRRELPKPEVVIA